MATSDHEFNSRRSEDGGRNPPASARVTPVPRDRYPTARTYVTDRAVLTVVEHDVTAFCERDPDGNERVASNDATLLDVADARLASAIEALTGQRISAVLSGSHPGSSSSFELFLLEG